MNSDAIISSENLINQDIGSLSSRIFFSPSSNSALRVPSSKSNPAPDDSAMDAPDQTTEQDCLLLRTQSKILLPHRYHLPFTIFSPQDLFILKAKRFSMIYHRGLFSPSLLLIFNLSPLAPSSGKDSVGGGLPCFLATT